MDKEPEDLQFLGFFGIYKEAFKITHSWRKLFSQIALSLILPFSVVFLAHVQVSDSIFTKIDRDDETLQYTHNESAREKILSNLTSEWIAFWLFKAVYLIMVLVLSLLSTSAVVYTVACVYSGKEVTFRKIMTVVPKVWKRLMVTFLCMFVITFAYNFVSVFLMVLVMLIGGIGAATTVIICAFFLIYLVGLVYISVVWHLASVISVLEDSYGISAMTKSKCLIKGKLLVASAIFISFSILSAVIEIVFVKLVVRGGGAGVAARLGYGFLLVLLLCLLILLGLVVQSVVYFVCKSYHHESIDKSCLSDHLEVYLGEYVPLKGSAVQLEQFGRL